MKGVNYKARLQPRAMALYAQGLNCTEIAEKLGIARSTAYEWIEDPDGLKKRARVDRYRGVCESCGGPTDGSDGPRNAPKVCQECREWPEEAIVEAMRDWAEANGGMPPTARQWHATDGSHPSAPTAVIERVGWNNLLLKAGFELRCDRRPETQASIERMIREGVPIVQIAEHFGCTPENIYKRMKTRGKRVSDLRRAA